MAPRKRKPSSKAAATATVNLAVASAKPPKPTKKHVAAATPIQAPEPSSPPLSSPPPLPPAPVRPTIDNKQYGGSVSPQLTLELRGRYVAWLQTLDLHKLEFATIQKMYLKSQGSW